MSYLTTACKTEHVEMHHIQLVDE